MVTAGALITVQQTSGEYPISPGLQDLDGGMEGGGWGWISSTRRPTVVTWVKALLAMRKWWADQGAVQAAFTCKGT